MASLYLSVAKIVNSRYLIRVMAIREIKSRYMQSLLGIFWALLQPGMMAVIYWFVFSLGFKLKPAGNVPFLVWFFCAFAPWTMFSEMITMSIGSIVDNRALIKRTLFPSQVFTLIYSAVAGFGHVIMLGLLVVMMLLYKIPLTLYAFQFLYYALGLVFLMVGLGWLVSALHVISRDTGQIVGIIMQVWFWATPIIYGPELVPEKFRFILKINPLYYVVNGYRDSFIYHRPFWLDLEAAGIFWVEVFGLFVIGALVFRKFRREFADVL